MYCTIVILCLECFHCYVIIIDCLLTSFDTLYFSTDGCINKSLTYLLTLLQSHHAEKDAVKIICEMNSTGNCSYYYQQFHTC